MGNSLRCCLACVLPCGALDLIRVVHLNGCVDELTGRVTAGEFLLNYPDHVLTDPCSHGVSGRILILSPESDLKRGSIYFLIPSSSSVSNNGKSKKPIKKYRSSKHAPGEKHSPPSRRRKVTAGLWRPQLDSIYEEL